ncbi:unnamed protein product [Sphagnum balticum]
MMSCCCEREEEEAVAAGTFLSANGFSSRSQKLGKPNESREHCKTKSKSSRFLGLCPGEVSATGGTRFFFFLLLLVVVVAARLVGEIEDDYHAQVAHNNRKFGIAATRERHAPSQPVVRLLPTHVPPSLRGCCSPPFLANPENPANGTEASSLKIRAFLPFSSAVSFVRNKPENPFDLAADLGHRASQRH